MKKNMDVLISLKAEIQAQKEGQDKIQKLCFENINIEEFTVEIAKLLSKYPDIVSLEFNDCNLYTLDNLQGFDNLTKLRLCNNKLDKECLPLIIKHFPKLTYLDLSGNKDITQNDLNILVELKDLQHLILGDLDRQKLFQIIPQLSYIDHKDKNGNDVADDDDDNEEEDDDEEDDDENESDEVEDEDEISNDEDEEEEEQDNEQENEEDDEDEEEEENQVRKQKKQ